MSLFTGIRDVVRSFFSLGNNVLTLAGVVLTTGSGITLAWFWLIELTSPHPVNPYLGILLFLILPGVFLVGLLLMPLGIWWRRRKLRKQGALPAEPPKVDLSSPGVRRALVTVGVATVLNIAILGTASFKGVEYMDSNQFCGLTCHTVMQPEYAAFVDSPHSRVGCAQCHIGPGADWFVKAKISGLRQVWAVTFDTFQRPVPSPVHALRPARETCEQCHWPQKFHGDKLLVRTHYAEDEANTPSTTVLLLKIGGHSAQGTTGIHGRHLDDASRITYVATDDRRQDIARVIYRDDKGEQVEYVSSEITATPEQLAKAEVRQMDCVDCHNRPTHAFELPHRALDKAMNEGRIARDLPYVKKVAMEALKREYPDHATAAQQIPQALDAYYRANHAPVHAARKTDIDAAARAVVAIYQRNVFPAMKVTWGTHPNHIGHEDFPGCFRCHAGSHTAPDGRMINADCNACHVLLAQDEKDPKVLKDLGIL